MKVVFKDKTVKDLHYTIASKLIKAGDCQPFQDERKKVIEENGVVKEPVKRSRKIV
jgi:hypothetical protein